MNEDKHYNLSNPQMNILEVEKQLLTKCNHIIVSIGFDGQLDMERLKRTLNKIIELNDSFQIKLVKDKGIVRQIFGDYTYQEIKEVSKIKDLEKYMNEFNDGHIDIFDKLYEFQVTFYKGKTYVLYKVHHIINDAWGTAQIGEQIKEIYPIIDKKEVNSLVKPSYKDALIEENAYFESKRFDRDKEFWSEYVKTLASEKMFNKEVSEIDATRVKKILDKNTCKKLKKYCEKFQISEYAFFLTVIGIYFLKMHDIQNLNIGTPFLNRNKANMETIGLFITNTPLNLKIKNNISFLEACKNVYNDSLKVFRRSKFPYKKIQKLYSEVNTTSNLFEVGYSYQINKLTNKMDKDIGVATWYFSNAQTNPITIHIYQMGSDVEIFYDYLNALFDEESIKLMHNIILHIIDQILDVQSDALLISDINVLTNEERIKIEKFNNTGRVLEDPKIIPEVFDQVCSKFARKVAIKCDENTLRYGGLYKKVVDLADQLREKGVKRETPVLLLFDKSLEMIVAMFAVIKAGGCYVPLLTDEDTRRRDFIIQDCNPAYILTTQEYADKIDKSNVLIVDLETLGSRTVNLENINSSDDTIYIIYTSGSTGTPKGTKVTHENVYGLMYSMLGDSKLKPTEEDVSMSLLKYSFDASGIDIYSALLNGGKLVLISKEVELNPEKVVKIMEKEEVTRSFLVPKWLEHINNEDKKLKTNLNKLKILGTGGEVFKPKLVEHLFNKYPNLNIINLYGPTETTMFSTYNVIKKENIIEDFTTIGKPIKYSRAFIINKINDILPTNTKGELFLAQDSRSIRNIAKGYLNLEELTNSKFIEFNNYLDENEMIRGYKTGDIALINDQLELEFVGRTDDIVKVNSGYLVSLNEVENRISLITGSKYRICVVPVNTNNTKTLVLFIESDNKELDSKVLKRTINSEISFYMRIRDVHIFSKFPLNNSGKIDRKKLKKCAEEKHRDEAIVLPKTKTEKKLYKILKKQCDLVRFSINDDLIDDLNIDSLDLSVIHFLIDDPKLKMQDLYTYTTVHELAEFIDNKKEITENLEFKDLKIRDNVKPFNMKNVLLLGSTGFLGIHILAQLLESKETKKIYCLVRPKQNMSGEDRLLDKFNYYFKGDKKLLKKLENKIEIIEGDINDKYLGLNFFDYRKFRKKINTVINSAANVSHYGKFEEFYDTNVSSLKNIIKLCGRTISLAHVSTLSIGGFKEENTESQIFDENRLYIGQGFKNNPYLITKFQAEYLLLNSELNLKIFRLGNVMPRNTDGIFQENYKDNAFMNAIRVICRMKKIPKSYLNFNVEFSPVEETADAIIKLLHSKSNNRVYHVLNNEEITIKQAIDFMDGNESVEILEDKEFMKSLQNYKEIGIEYVKEYILQTNINQYSSVKTIEELKKQDFKWSKTDKKYLQNVLKIIRRGGWKK